MDERVIQIAEKVREAGGNAYLVGGYVRDAFLKIPSKDYDIEVHGLESHELKQILLSLGKVDIVGESFQVFKLGQDIDVSLPRREVKTGKGHKGFLTESDPSMSIKEACSRRDFTINAIMQDILTGGIEDPFDGLSDLKAGLLRVVSPNSFQEDSLRVLRLAQFSSRFGFQIKQETFELAKATDLSDLPKERVWMELEKLFLKSKSPVVGVENIYNLEIDKKCFPSLVEYEELYPALNRASNFCNDLAEGEKLAVYITILIWNSDIKALDELGVTSVDGYNVNKVVKDLIENTPKEKVYNDYLYHKLAQKLPMKLFGRLMYSYANEDAEEFTNIIERLGIENGPVEPVIKGRDLIALGMQPSEKMGEILNRVYDAQMRGIESDKLSDLAKRFVGEIL